MISSGLKVPIPAIPMPLLAVPIPAPAELRTRAAAQPANPKNGANAGASSVEDIDDKARDGLVIRKIKISYVSSSEA